MKIVSTFTDFYDDAAVEKPKLRPVYHRHIVSELDIEKKYKRALLDIRVGSDIETVIDLSLRDYRTDTNSYEFVAAIPKVLGIGGELHYYVAYLNTVLGIRKNFFDYASLARFYKHPTIERSFKMYESGVCKKYCYAQFKAVNFLLWENKGKINIIKEPVLNSEPETIPLTKEYVYSTIESFLLARKATDLAYKDIKPTRYMKELKGKK